MTARCAVELENKTWPSGVFTLSSLAGRSGLRPVNMLDFFLKQIVSGMGKDSGVKNRKRPLVAVARNS